MDEDDFTKELGFGEILNGPTSCAVQVWVTAEEDGSYSLRILGEPIEAGDSWLNMKSETYPDAGSTLVALREMGFDLEEGDLPRRATNG